MSFLNLEKTQAGCCEFSILKGRLEATCSTEWLGHASVCTLRPQFVFNLAGAFSKATAGIEHHHFIQAIVTTHERSLVTATCTYGPSAHWRADPPIAACSTGYVSRGNHQKFRRRSVLHQSLSPEVMDWLGTITQTLQNTATELAVSD